VSSAGSNRAWRALVEVGQMSKPRRNNPWTSRELDWLEELRGQGLSYPKIALLLGRTVRSVESQGWLYGFWRRSRLGEWLHVLSKPHTLKSAAEAMGTSVAGAVSAVHRLRAEGYRIPQGIGGRRPRPKPVKATPVGIQEVFFGNPG
jgi:hypothetical protein